MRKVIIMSGVSGSGKSTHANGLVTSLGVSHTVKVVSADNYFMKDGVYNFDPTKLSEAHGACFYDFIDYLAMNKQIVIVDNTNTTEVEIAPYILGATAHGYEAEIVTLTPGHAGNWVDYYVRCAERNAHGVGIETIKAQHKRIINRKLPPWWKNTDITETVP